VRCSQKYCCSCKFSYDFFSYSSDIEDAPFAEEYLTTGAAVAGSKKDSFIDF
jgi:hypothetical protein